MKCLAYAILNAAEIRQTPLPRDIDEAEDKRAVAVHAIVEDGLALVFSRVKDETSPPDHSRLLAFARVIADLGADRTVLPVRYGTLLANEDQGRGMLRCRHAAFVAALAEVDGCVEMSLRVPTRLVRAGSVSDGQAWPVAYASGSDKPADGSAYLLGRRTHYLNQDNARQLEEELMGRFRAAFVGLFVRCQPEAWHVGSESDRRYPALHFLVRRESLERFRQAFRRLQEIESDPVLLTGPWAPFNFVNLQVSGISTELLTPDC